VSWTADPGAGVKPGELQAFSISAGPLPKTDTLVLPAIQGYDDGTEVAWIEPTADGQAEPKHPAPTLNLATSNSGSAETSTASSQSTTSADSGTSGVAVTALVLGIVGVLATLTALGLALSSRGRNTTT
jgi:hypothetical protein